MASNDGLRIGKGSLATVAGLIGTIVIAAGTQASNLSTRIGQLERQVTAIESRHDAEQESTLRRLDHITTVVEKIRDDMASQ